jgi:NADPH-dependent 2,4-dienoyl-CoA reductase/sulfur reductase-like enzyme
MDSIKTRVKGDLAAVVGKGKPNVNILRDTHHASADGNVSG